MISFIVLFETTLSYAEFLHGRLGDVCEYLHHKRRDITCMEALVNPDCVPDEHAGSSEDGGRHESPGSDAGSEESRESVEADEAEPSYVEVRPDTISPARREEVEVAATISDEASMEWTSYVNTTTADAEFWAHFEQEQDLLMPVRYLQDAIVRPVFTEHVELLRADSFSPEDMDMDMDYWYWQ